MSSTTVKQPTESEIEDFNKKLKETIKKIERKLPKLKEDLESKLTKYGSTELLANIAIEELFAQNPVFHDPQNPMSENPFLVFLLGIFLQKNNLKHGEPHPIQITEVIDSITKYFDSFKSVIMPMDPDSRKDTDSLVFTSRLKKIVDDGNPHCYPYQKHELVQTIFSPINDYLESHYGFSINDALDYQGKIEERIERMLREKSKSVRQIVENAEKQMDDHKSDEFIKRIEKDGWTKENFIRYFGHTHFLWGSKNILIINPNEFCKEENIVNVQSFKNFLKTFSCKIGDQFNNFENPLSDNIIFYKPIIQIDENKFFIPKPDFLKYKLDVLLEYLLKDEKKNKTKIWQNYDSAKSKYLEDKTYEYFSRIFPKKYLYRNLFYRFENKRPETDLLLIYDDKIFVIESKSNHLPLSAKRGGMTSLEHSLKKIIKKAYDQAANVCKYIRSNEIVEFENDQGEVVLTINSKETDYEFFFINITLENLGSIGTNLRELDVFQSFSKKEYPWSVNLYDLDIISDCLPEPTYFIHYLEQRIQAQNQNIFHSAEEIDFLGYYYKVGNFYKEILDHGTEASTIMIAPDYFDVLDKHYLLDEKKPELVIPSKLDELIKNMQKYYQKGFTKITSLLLDFPQPQRKLIAKSLEEKFNKTVKTGKPDGVTSALGQPFDIGFSYFTSTTMKNFHKNCKNQFKRRKYQQKITRWAMIGRSVIDKKNFATFFLYDETPWHHDPVMEEEISRVFGN